MRAPKLFHKPIMFMVIIFGMIATASSIMFSYQINRELTKEYESKAMSLARSLAESDLETVLRGDVGSIQARIDQYLDIAGVAYVAVANEKGEVLAHTFTPVMPEEVREQIRESSLGEAHYRMVDLNIKGNNYLHVSNPILGGFSGTVHIGMDKGLISNNIRSAILQQQGITLILFLASVVLAYLFILSISRPVSLLAEYARKVAAKDFSSVPRVESRDEIGDLAQAMESMAQHIAEQVNNLEDRVSQKTLELQDAKDALERTVKERTRELLRTNTQLKIEVAERKVIGDALRNAEKKYRSIFENAVEGIYQITPSGRFVSANPALAKKLGYSSPDELMGSVYDYRTQLCLDPFLRDEFVAQLEKDGEVKNFESQIRRKDGRIIWISENARRVEDSEGSLLYYEGSVEDITLRKKAESQLRRQAFHDPLTGLPNRALFLDHLRMAMERSRRRKYLFAVLYLDLDRFKVINDSLGHETGDELLKSVSRVLEQCARSVDTVARFGGDEFAILLEEITRPRDAIVIARRILDGVQQPFALRGNEVFTSASIGIVLKTDSYDKPESLLRDADTAMYRAKEMGKSRFKVFNQKMHDQALKLMALETDLRRAVDLKEFMVYYQPIVDLSTRTISGFEALVRWFHPELGFISPADFVPLAEDTGLIYAIDNFVLEEACRQVRDWHVRFGHKTGPLTLNLNISGKHFGQTLLVNQVQRALDNSGLEAQYLNIELTESALMEHPHLAEEMLHQLKSTGINLSIDDFGTGYSSLSYLQRFPIDVVKVDRSFVMRVVDDPDSQAIVKTVFSLGASLGLKVVAEGVETEEQLKFIEGEGCRYVQGYLFYRPMSPQDVEEMFEQGKAIPKRV